MLYLKNMYYLINSSLVCGCRSKIMWWGRKSGSDLHLRLISSWLSHKSSRVPKTLVMWAWWEEDNLGEDYLDCNFRAQYTQVAWSGQDNAGKYCRLLHILHDKWCKIWLWVTDRRNGRHRSENYPKKRKAGLGGSYDHVFRVPGL